MYVDHFKLSDRPFSNGPDTGFFVPNTQVETAVARLREVMLSHDSMAIVTGGPGVGKTAFIAAARASIEDKAAVVNVDLRHSDAEMLSDMLLLGLGGNTDSNATEAGSLHRLRLAIQEQNRNGRRVTAVVDVSGMTVERAKRILQLVHLAGAPGGQLNIILLGPHALHRLMNAPGLIHLRQRVAYRHRVRPLTFDEVNCYLEEQFERAGGNIGSILAEGAADTVFRYVGGVPRLINTLMDAALSEAAVAHADRVDPGLVNQVAKELGWKQLSGNRPVAPVRPAAAAAAKPPELTMDQGVGSAPAASGPKPMSEASAAMLLDSPFDGGDDAAAPELPKATDKLGDSAAVMPEMSASDTSATGMLRLEDLDSRFAETIFGEDANKAASDAIAAAAPMLEDEQLAS
ncbi:MAG: ExeA family protein [Gammaproteobacteria bacterium]